jgi:hypothetical protein
LILLLVIEQKQNILCTRSIVLQPSPERTAANDVEAGTSQRILFLPAVADIFKRMHPSPPATPTQSSSACNPARA